MFVAVDTVQCCYFADILMKRQTLAHCIFKRNTSVTGHKLGTLGIPEHKKSKVNCELRSQYHYTADYIRVRMVMYGFYVAGEHSMDAGIKDVHSELCKVQNNWANTQ
jgi:hypothetical protein